MTGPTIPLGRAAGRAVALSARYANRHALIAGATGTGKTTTLATLAEGFSRLGVPVALLDAKGDLAGLARGGAATLLDPFGLSAPPAPLDLSAVGPDLIARALDLSDAQAGALDVADAFARDTGAPLSSLADLRALLTRMAGDHRALSGSYGLVTPSSLAAVQRAALRLERDAAPAFGSPGVDVARFEAKAPDGRGLITVIDGSRLARTPGLYGAFAAFILSDLYARAPEVGDLDAPRLAVIIDESHLLFQDAPTPLVRRLESIVRLIRSKGVALIFASQSPADLPPGIAGQLQTRVQHGLRAVTALDLRSVRAAADTLPRAPGLDAFREIQRLGVGVALVSVMRPDGTPSPAALAKIQRPAFPLGPLSEAERAGLGLAYVATPEPARPVASTMPSPVAIPCKPGRPWRLIAVLAILCVLLGVAGLSG